MLLNSNNVSLTTIKEIVTRYQLLSEEGAKPAPGPTLSKRKINKTRKGLETYERPTCDTPQSGNMSLGRLGKKVLFFFSKVRDPENSVLHKIRSTSVAERTCPHSQR
jgi:hypothetical protein